MCSQESAPPRNLPAARPSVAPCCRGVDTAGPCLARPLASGLAIMLRPRLLSGFFDHAPEGSSGAGANPRCCCQGCTAGGKAWPGWMDGQQRARTEQLGVPGFQGTQAGIGPSTPPPQYPPSYPRLGTICLPRRASILRAASYLFVSGLSPRPETRSSLLGTGKTDLRIWAQLARTSSSI